MSTAHCAVVRLPRIVPSEQMIGPPDPAVESADEDVVPTSDRLFGVIFAVYCFAVSLSPVYLGQLRIYGWLAGAGGAFLSAAVLFPEVLAPANRAWYRFGRALDALATRGLRTALEQGLVPLARRLGLLTRGDTASYWRRSGMGYSGKTLRAGR